MAESKSSLLAKSVQKHAGRAKEKLLQNLGKVDRTADEIFDEHLTNFTKQNSSATKLQKEFSNYIRCVRAAQLASKALMDAVAEVYEPHWCGYDELISQITTSDVVWQEFSHKLGDQVLIPLNTYTAQFPDMKKKIEKRNRKLIDYDSQRHSFQNLQANASKRKDDIKLTKGREQLEEARRTYEILNTELHDELPALYDSRILFLVTNLQTLFASEQIFHNEVSKIFAELESIVDKLATESQRGSYTMKKTTVNISKDQSLQQLPIKTTMNHTNENNSYQNQSQITNGGTLNKPSSPVSSSSSPSSHIDTEDDEKELSAPVKIEKIESKEITNGVSNHNDDNNGVDKESDDDENENTTAAVVAAVIKQQPMVVSETTTPNLVSPNSNVPPPRTTTPKDRPVETNPFEQENEDKKEKNAKDAGGANAVVVSVETKTSENVPKNEPVNGNQNDDKKVSVDKKIDVKNNNSEGISTSDLPGGVLYRVKATYSYDKEDVDELSFEIGDVIRVIEYDDPEDQEEGWLMGQKEGTNEKGMFPANFTRPI